MRTYVLSLVIPPTSPLCTCSHMLQRIISESRCCSTGVERSLFRTFMQYSNIRFHLRRLCAFGLGRQRSLSKDTFSIYMQKHTQRHITCGWHCDRSLTGHRLCLGAQKALRQRLLLFQHSSPRWRRLSFLECSSFAFFLYYPAGGCLCSAEWIVHSSAAV